MPRPVSFEYVPPGWRNGIRCREVKSRSLAGEATLCFNPSLVEHDGNIDLFYRYTTQRLDGTTAIGCSRLNECFKPQAPMVPVRLNSCAAPVCTFDDPRSFVWNGSVWLVHGQGALAEGARWANAVVISRIESSGAAAESFSPSFGCNYNIASGGSDIGQEKNWVPLVHRGALFLVYALNPLTVLRVEAPNVPVRCVVEQPWTSPFPGHMSGGTPFIQIAERDYLCMFHSYARMEDGSRTYSIGACIVQAEPWKVTYMSPTPIIAGWSNVWFDRRYTWIRKAAGLVRPLYPLSRVIFPGGLLRVGDQLVVAAGWNDCRTLIMSFDAREVIQRLVMVQT